MADQGPIYGLDAEVSASSATPVLHWANSSNAAVLLNAVQLKAKRDAKYSVEEEQKVVAWIEELTGLSKGDKGFAEWLKVRNACSQASAR